MRNLIIWFSVEKLFMTSIGFTDQTISLSVALFCAVSLLVEIPSGILADRWSCKGVMILAATSFLFATVIGAWSTSVTVYLFSAICYGIYDALASGTDEATIYDLLVEETGSADMYEKEFSIYRSIMGVALIIASLVGGFVGQFVGLRDAYFISIPFCIVAIVALFFFKEPVVHKRAAKIEIVSHIRMTFRAIFRNHNLVATVIALLSLTIAIGLLDEMHQLWYIELSTPITIMGVATACIYGIWGFGASLVRILSTRTTLIICAASELLASLALVYGNNYFLILIAQFIVAATSSALAIIATAEIQHTLTSSIRSGAGSAISSVARLVTIPLLLVFGWLSNAYTIFGAAWLLVALSSVVLISLIASPLRRYQYALY